MTDPIQHLRELLANATGGPWNDEYPEEVLAPRLDREGDEGPWKTVAECSTEDAALIVAAINALPALLDVAEAARYTSDTVAASRPEYPDIGGLRALKEALTKLEKKP